MQIAIVMKNLMSHLGYERYYVQGGDWGGVIVQAMAALFPEKIIGLHSNFCIVNTPLSYLKMFLGGFFPSLLVKDEIKDLVFPVQKRILHFFKEAGYMHIQVTKPDTLGMYQNLINIRIFSRKCITKTETYSC